MKLWLPFLSPRSNKSTVGVLILSCIAAVFGALYFSDPGDDIIDVWVHLNILFKNDAAVIAYLHDPASSKERKLTLEALDYLAQRNTPAAAASIEERLVGASGYWQEEILARTIKYGVKLPSGPRLMLASPYISDQSPIVSLIAKAYEPDTVYREALGIAKRENLETDYAAIGQALLVGAGISGIDQNRKEEVKTALAAVNNYARAKMSNDGLWLEEQSLERDIAEVLTARDSKYKFICPDSEKAWMSFYGLKSYQASDVIMVEDPDDLPADEKAEYDRHSRLRHLADSIPHRTRILDEETDKAAPLIASIPEFKRKAQAALAAIQY